MSTFLRHGKIVAKFQLHGQQRWVPGGPWPNTRDGKRQAQEAERRYRDRLRARKTSETCASFAERWLAEWPRPAASTRQLYAQAAQRFGDEFGPTPLGEVERLSARSWALTIPRNLSKIIGTMYEDARNIGLVETNPFSNLRLPRTEKTEEVHPLTVEEFRSLLHSCVLLGGYAGEMRSLITFTAWMGLRSGEVQGLQWQDVGRDYVDVRRARKDDGVLGPPKNNSTGEVPFIEPARVLDQVPRRHNSPFVFHTAQGLPLNKSNMYYAWNQVRGPINLERKAAGIPGLRFHDLRHTAATWLLERGYSHFEVSVHLRHDDGGALVMSRYGHPSKDAARRRLLQGFAPTPTDFGSRAGSEV